MNKLSWTGIALCALAVACSSRDAGIAAPGGGTGLSRVLLTDTPFPYDALKSVDIYVVKVEASSAPDSSSISDPSTWSTIAEPHRAFDILSLTGGTTALLGEAKLSAGSYRAVRVTIDVDSSGVVRADGTPATVYWQASGRTMLDALVQAPLDAPAEGADIVLDFDLARSFQQAGGDALVFVPWIRAVNAAATGAVAGEVAASADALQHLTVVAYRGDTGGPLPFIVVSTTRVAADGTFRMPYLLAGSYAVRAEADGSSGLYVSDFATVTVAAGADVGTGPLTLHPFAGGPGGPDSTGTPGGGGGGGGGGGSDSLTVPVDSGGSGGGSDSTVLGAVTGRR